VLIVDDEPDIRDSFRDLLEGEGYTVELAGSGQEALAMLRTSRRPLVVLLDLMMPVMRGDMVIEELVREHRLPGKHAIVLITASPPTVPRSLHPLLAKLQIPIKRKDISTEEIVAALDQAAERIEAYQARPW
jgi:two-component system response regulator MprA